MEHEKNEQKWTKMTKMRGTLAEHQRGRAWIDQCIALLQAAEQFGMNRVGAHASALCQQLKRIMKRLVWSSRGIVKELLAAEVQQTGAPVKSLLEWAPTSNASAAARNTETSRSRDCEK